MGEVRMKNNHGERYRNEVAKHGERYRNEVAKHGDALASFTLGQSAAKMKVRQFNHTPVRLGLVLVGNSSTGMPSGLDGRWPQPPG